MTIRESYHHVVNIYKEAYFPLKQCPREMWIVFGLKFLESYAYFAISLVLTLYLSEEFGYSDIDAGWIYGIHGLLATLYGAITGPVMDYVGIRKALVLGGVITFIGRVLLAIAMTRVICLVTLFVIIPSGMSLLIPVMTVAVKRYSNDASRTAAFGLYYAVMNIAALCSGFIVDIFRLYLSLRLLFVTGAIASLIMTVIAVFGFRDVTLSQTGSIQSYKPPRPPMKQFLKQTFQNPIFYKLMLFSLLITGVRQVFRHLDASFPKYWERKGMSNFGSIYSINPAIIIIGVPLVAGYTKGYDDLNMIIYGSWVSALSVFFLCIGAEYWAAVLFIIMLSIGEAFYSPRVYEYAMKMAPKGLEGVYTNLSSAPLFLAKLLVGGFSGFLLETYCPEKCPDQDSQCLANPPKRDCAMVWFWVGISAITSPIFMMLLRKYLELPPHDEEQDEQEMPIMDGNNSSGNNNNNTNNNNDNRNSGNSNVTGSSSEHSNEGKPTSIDL